MDGNMDALVDVSCMLLRIGLDFHLLSDLEIAAWLAENGPVSVALNAFAMQVTDATLLLYASLSSC